MQEKKRIPLKRLHRLRNARKQAAETDDLTPMMKAIKAVHSVTSTGSTQPEDLERQRAAQELFGRLVTPNLLINTTPITVNNVSAEWVRMNQGHDRRHVVLYCHGGGYTCGQLGYARIVHRVGGVGGMVGYLADGDPLDGVVASGRRVPVEQARDGEAGCDRFSHGAPPLRASRSPSRGGCRA